MKNWKLPSLKSKQHVLTVFKETIGWLSIKKAWKFRDWSERDSGKGSGERRDHYKDLGPLSFVFPRYEMIYFKLRL